MKLFRDKNRGPRVKREDVVIPEAYLEYEREAEEKKRAEAQAEEPIVTKNAAGDMEAELDAFRARMDSIMNNHPKAELEETSEEIIVEAESATKEPVYEAPTKKSDVKENNKAKKRRGKSEKKVENMPSGFKGFLAAIVVGVATIVVMLGPVMAIDEVEINDIKYISQDKVLEMAGFPVGENLFRYPASKTEKAMLDYPYVQDVEISRHFPRRLEINITEREPAGVLMNNGNYLQFSKDGILLDNTKSLSNQNLPLITGFSMDEIPSPGGAFKDNVRFKEILRIINACDDDLLKMLQEINIKDRNNILAYTSQGLEIRIGSVKDIEARMATLNDIVNQVILSGIIEEPIEAIDIRYKKSPVVVLEGYSHLNLADYTDNEPNEDAERTDGSGENSEEDGEASESTNAPSSEQ